MTTLALLIAVLLLPLIVILWLSETTTQRANRLRGNGWSQNRIAQHMGISRYRVRMALT
jgi:ABC-type spermidine/putrescine transport system permease subunit II